MRGGFRAVSAWVRDGRHGGMGHGMARVQRHGHNMVQAQRGGEVWDSRSFRQWQWRHGWLAHGEERQWGRRLAHGGHTAVRRREAGERGPLASELERGGEVGWRTGEQAGWGRKRKAGEVGRGRKENGRIRGFRPKRILGFLILF